MVGFVWQQGGRNLIPYLNAQENIELPMTLAGIAGRNKRRHAQELLDAVGLLERRKHRLSELSGGEQQRVAIAVALANSPHLLLADEPTGELDSNTALSIYRTFQDLNQRLGLTILIVSHDPTIARHVNRVVAIRDGKLATETVRQSRSVENGAAKTGDGQDGAGAGQSEEHHEDMLEELTVLDSAGRLQIPKDYLQRVNIRSHVTLEVTEAGILIKPAGDVEHHVSAEDLGAALAASKRTGKPRRLLDRVLNAVNPNRGKNEG
jgi:ABC-type methionine transport system ATPase subunit